MATAPTAIPMSTAPIGRFGRWSGPGFALIAGLAFAFKPAFDLWSAGAPWILNVYQNVAIGAGDIGLILLAASGWLGGHARPLPPAARALAIAGVVLLACLSLSSGTAQAPPLAYAAVARCAIGLLATLAIARRPALIRWLIIGGIGALLVQVPFVALQLLTQSTFPAGLLLDGWSREVTAAMSGAAVITGPNGLRWQRAVGTFPHPNILGGFVAVGLVLALPSLLRDERRGTPSRLPPALWSLGWLVLLLTFSRAALLAVALGCGSQLLTRRTQVDRSLIRLVAAPVATLVLVVLLLGPVLLDRFAVGRSSPSVQERNLIAGIAWQLIRENPLRGVGAGNFTLAELRPEFDAASVEPAHAVPLLVAAESGIVAGLAWLALFIAPLATEWRQARRIEMAQLGLPTALLTLALLDHYLWTFGPGRAIFWLALGVWVAGCRLTSCKLQVEEPEPATCNLRTCNSERSEQ